MSLEVIYVARHGFRSNWLVDPSTGAYRAAIRTPTGIAADPALTAHGVGQARELAARLAVAAPPVEVVYSSPYYRCLQTVEPFVRLVQEGREEGSSSSSSSPAGTRQARKDFKVRAEAGISEWYGAAPFEHPVPAPQEKLRELFPGLLDESYDKSDVVPPRLGETIAQLHNRVAKAAGAIIDRCDREGVRAVLLCSHAATMVALGRALTGHMPEDVEVEDFRVFTCGLSVYRRRRPEAGAAGSVQRTGSRQDASSLGPDSLQEDWTGGRGVRGGWDCEVNCDCSFLSGGEERGWRFSGDESFRDTNASHDDAGLELGVVVEGHHGNTGSPHL